MRIRTLDARSPVLLVLMFLGLCLGPAVERAEAQNSLGGHIGTVVDLFTSVDGETSDIGDDFVQGFPMGITVKTPSAVAFDMEFVPVINEGRVVNVVFHPGILTEVAPRWTFGVRGALETAGPYGITPLLNYAFAPLSNSALFLELVMPLRRALDANDEGVFVIGFGLHFGIAF